MFRNLLVVCLKSTKLPGEGTTTAMSVEKDAGVAVGAVAAWQWQRKHEYCVSNRGMRQVHFEWRVMR